MLRSLSAGWLASSVVLLLACASQVAKEGDATPVEITVPPGAERSVATARALLAEKLGVSAGEIRLTRVESIEWSDTSLGCPQPGSFYAQVVTPGYRLLLDYGGEQYEFHADRHGRVVSCAD